MEVLHLFIMNRGSPSHLKFDAIQYQSRREALIALYNNGLVLLVIRGQKVICSTEIMYSINTISIIKVWSCLLINKSRQLHDNEVYPSFS